MLGVAREVDDRHAAAANLALDDVAPSEGGGELGGDLHERVLGVTDALDVVPKPLEGVGPGWTELTTHFAEGRGERRCVVRVAERGLTCPGSRSTVRRRSA